MTHDQATVTTDYSYTLVTPFVVVGTKDYSLKLQVAGPGSSEGTAQYGPTEFIVAFSIGSSASDLAGSLGSAFPTPTSYPITMTVPTASGGTESVAATWTVKMSGDSTDSLAILVFSTKDKGIATGNSLTVDIGPFSLNSAPGSAGLSITEEDPQGSTTVAVTKVTPTPQILSFKAVPATPALCETVQLQWTVIGGVSVTLGPDVPGLDPLSGKTTVPLSGSGVQSGMFEVPASPLLLTGQADAPSCPTDRTSPISDFTIYNRQFSFEITLTDENGGSLSDPVEITLQPVSISLSFDPSAVNYDQSATVIWDVTNADGAWEITESDGSSFTPTTIDQPSASATVYPRELPYTGKGTTEDPFLVTLTLEAGGYPQPVKTTATVTINPLSLGDVAISPKGPYSADEKATVSWTAISAKSVSLIIGDHDPIDVTGKDSYTFVPQDYRGSTSTVTLSLTAEGLGGTSASTSPLTLELETVKILSTGLLAAPGQILGLVATASGVTQTISFPNTVVLEWSTEFASALTLSAPHFSPISLSPTDRGQRTFTATELFTGETTFETVFTLTAEGHGGPVTKTMTLKPAATRLPTVLLGPAYVYDGRIDTSATPYYGAMNPEGSVTCFAYGGPEYGHWVLKAAGVADVRQLDPSQQDDPLKSFFVRSSGGVTAMTFPKPVSGLSVSFPYGEPSGTHSISDQSVVFQDVTTPFVFQLSADGGASVSWYAAPA